VEWAASAELIGAVTAHAREQTGRKGTATGQCMSMPTILKHNSAGAMPAPAAVHSIMANAKTFAARKRQFDGGKKLLGRALP
jgi:hypothetical protein